MRSRYPNASLITSAGSVTRPARLAVQHTLIGHHFRQLGILLVIVTRGFQNSVARNVVITSNVNHLNRFSFHVECLQAVIRWEVHSATLDHKLRRLPPIPAPLNTNCLQDDSLSSTLDAPPKTP